MTDNQRPFLFSIDKSGTTFPEQSYAVKKLNDTIYKLSIATLNPFTIKPLIDYNQDDKFMQRLYNLADAGNRPAILPSNTDAFARAMKRKFFQKPSSKQAKKHTHKKLHNYLVYDLTLDTYALKCNKTMHRLHETVTDFKLSTIMQRPDAAYTFDNFDQIDSRNKKFFRTAEAFSLDNSVNLISAFADNYHLMELHNQMSKYKDDMSNLGGMFAMGASVLLQHTLRQYAIDNDIPLIAINRTTDKVEKPTLSVIDRNTTDYSRHVHSGCPTTRICRPVDYFNACQMMEYHLTNGPLMDTPESLKICKGIDMFNANYPREAWEKAAKRIKAPSLDLV